mgnify:FL=1|jgi:hypothetical protein|tara:strand:- start:147 stop:350 length:204 start_codon:yes stop_codon:yes gene_type:complete
MNSKLLDNKSATKSVSSAKEKNKPVNDFIEITGIKRNNFTSITPPSIKKEIEVLIGNGSAKVLLWRE